MKKYLVFYILTIYFIFLPCNFCLADKQEEYLLLEATGNGDISKVKELLDKGVKVDAINRKRQTPLIVAADSGFENIVNLLLLKGANVNGSDIYRGYAFNISSG